MDEQRIFELVTGAMEDLFELDPERLTRETRFDALDLSSLDAIDLIVELQQLTGRKVVTDTLRDVRTLGDVVAMVKASGV